jgi:hypothetical protein
MSDVPKGFVTAGHDVLFEESAETRCDVCGTPVPERALDRSASASEDDDEGPLVGGRGLLVWARGDERRYQEPPLCPACAAAIGVSALQRWEIEEEEG